MSFIKNAWYMAGWSGELSDQLLARRLFDRQIVLFRQQDGSIAALADRCPHRFAPLSKGERRGDVIQCGYHGLTFDGSGTCIHNPFSDKIPAAAKVQSWAVAERDGIIWLWGGDRAKADNARIPDFDVVADRANRKVLRGHTVINAPYEYCTDNLMDLSHIEFVHKGTFAGDGVIFVGQHSVEEDGDTLHSNWWMPNVPAPMPTRAVFGEGALVDHWLDMRWNAPASMRLNLGATLPGQPRENGFAIGGQAHIVTPETATTSHYFTANARHEDIDDPGVDAFLTQLFATAFEEEDKPIIEAAYANLDGQGFWEAQPLSLGVDVGGTRARRKIQALIKAEER
jgi:phenylpropionate dioxygenase-like ring-hydroxylating dioxygenase large terminal subunit